MGLPVPLTQQSRMEMDLISLDQCLKDNIIGDGRLEA